MPLNAADIEILSDGCLGAMVLIPGDCKVNGEEVTLIAFGSAAHSTLTVTIEVDDDRVQLDHDSKQLKLDGQPVLVEPYGYRPDPWQHTVHLDLQAKSLRISAGEE